ncbi:glycine--tRNA ligase subunit beta [Sphingomonas spermidinifaciens]|uniref:Glycine--tRNA ligase beta subunit n=1 Tax=Sphingomonas spermidinifaciens TaxID=1141889 RepID=A0A2A4B538_9SPHN|nr:glycine--tRNA ligase subunit beta [Sphingomonas spermidinifaciens]PCD03062.1 glycine--tRNA ligase subunit beta [Sphingomonas spermidinifaciens]
MTDFLLELRSEEIPARMQDRARADLEKLFVAELAKAGILAGGMVTYATPRRLALIARDLPDATEGAREEVKGPRTSAPEQALEGFLRKTGLTRDQLTERDGVWFAVTEKPGRATAEVLAAAIPAIVRAFPWPKSMRWGDASLSSESLRWVRPLQGIVAIFGQELVPCEVAGIESGFATVGHRFHSPHAITIGGAHDYAEKLRACHVIVDQDERRALIRERAGALAAGAGLKLIEDEGLVAENAGLTEWPVPLLGRFDEAFLDVPAEVIQLTARVNQKYFVCEGADGGLANAFVCVANIEAKDGGEKIVAGNQKVLAARLSDARFFYETDLKVPLEEQAKKLEKIVFHEKLGTVADKVERVAKLARWLVEEGIVKGADPAHAERAARLAKADLVTGMVGEFPELQGLMGGYYAKAQGEPTEVWEAVRDHYKPVGQGDEVPTVPLTVAVSLADKLDTIVSFFTGEMPPTGSRDPYALRRACLGAIQLIAQSDLRLPLEQALSLVTAMVWIQRENAEIERDRPRTELIDEALRIGGIDQDGLSERARLALVIAAHPDIEILDSKAPAKVLDFFADRLKVQQREAGVRHDLIDAVFALGGEDDLVRLLARVHALQGFVATGEGTNLLAGYKRAANILKKEAWQEGPALAASPAPQFSLADMAEQSKPFGDEPRRMPDEARFIAADLAGGNIPQTGEEDPLAEPAGQDAAGAAAGERSDDATPVFEPAEAALIAALDAAEPRAAAAIEAEDFEGAMAALASLRAPIDAFFETVTVNDADPAKRQRRLELLARMRAAVHRVADFSKIEG